MKANRRIFLMQEALGLNATGIEDDEFRVSLERWKSKKGITSEEEIQESMYFSVQSAVYIDSKKTSQRPCDHPAIGSGLCGAILYTSRKDLPEDLGNMDPIIVEDAPVSNDRWIDLAEKIRRNYGMHILIDSSNLDKIGEQFCGAVFNSIDVPNRWRSFYAIRNGNSIEVFREY